MTTGETFGYFLVRDTNTQPLPLPGLDSDRIAVVRGPPGLEQTYWASLHAGGGGIGIVADGVWNSLGGATVALGSDTVTVSGAAFTAADVGKRFTMMRGGSPVSFAGGNISNRGTGYRAGNTITVAGATANVWSVTTVGTAVVASGGSGGPANAQFIVKGLSVGRRGRRDAARITVQTNASGVVTGIVRVDKGGVYIDPLFNGTGASTAVPGGTGGEPFDARDFPGLVGLKINLTLGVNEVRRNASCFYGRITGTTLTIEELVYGTPAIGNTLSGIEVIEGTTITAGSALSWTISAAHADMDGNVFLFIAETRITTTSPGSGVLPTTGGSGSGLTLTPLWRGIPLVGNIIAVPNPTSVQLDVTAASAATNVGYCCGTDYGPTIQAALDAGQEVNLPAGVICHSVPLIFKNKSRLVGRGSSLGNSASTILAYVGANSSRGKQLSGDADITGHIDGCVLGNCMLLGNNLIGIGLYTKGVSGSQFQPLAVRAHTHIGVQFSGALDGASVGNIHSHLVVREMDSPGWDTTGIYIGPGVLPAGEDIGVNDVCRTLFPYWQVDTDAEGFGRAAWYRVADSNSHGFVKARGPGDLPTIEFAGHDSRASYARSIHFSYLDTKSLRLRGGVYPAQVVASFQNFLNGGEAADVDGTPDAGATDDDEPEITTEFGARYVGVSNAGTLIAPRLQPYHFATRQQPRADNWMLYPITNSNTNIPGAEITGSGSYSVLAFTDANETLRVLSPSLTTFDAFGAVGNGTHDDTVAIQAAINANAGGTIYGSPGKTYAVSTPLYIPSDTKVIGEGATIGFKSPLPAQCKAIFIVGSAGEPTGYELASADVEISGWRFITNIGSGGAGGQTAIYFQPGSERVLIRGNHFESTYSNNPSMTAIFMDRKGLRDIHIDGNTYFRIQRFVYVRGSEIFAGSNYSYNVLSPTNVVEQEAGVIASAAAGTTYFMVPTVAPDGETISPLARMLPPHNWRWGVTFSFTDTPSKNYRLYSAAEGASPADIIFNGTDRVTFGAHIGAAPTDPDPADPDNEAVTRFFLWNPAIEPGNDVVGLSITNNSGAFTTSSPVQLSCQIMAYRKGAEPKIDGLRNVIIDSNRLEFAFNLGRTVTNVAITDEDEPSSTNYALYSEDFSNAVWTRTGIGTPVPGIRGPRYDTSRAAGSRLYESATAGEHKVVQTVTVPVATGGNWTASIFLQAGTFGAVRLTLDTPAGVGGYVDVDLITGTVTGSGAVGAGTLNWFAVTPYGDGWYRAILNVANATTSVRFTLAMARSGTSYTGVATNYINAFGLQAETSAPLTNAYILRNSTPTLYKPTVGAKVKDIWSNVISINGTTNFIVTNNIISSSPGQGIHVEDTSSFGTIAHNVITDCRFGINVMACSNITISDNIITRFSTRGISVTGGESAKRVFEASKWCQFTGYIAGTTLTVSAVSIGNLLSGVPTFGAGSVYKTLNPDGLLGLQAGVRILSQLTGTAGQAGTYQLSTTETVGAVGDQKVMSAGFGIQTENLVVTNNTVDASGFQGVQAAYWFSAAYDNWGIVFTGGVARGLSAAVMAGDIAAYETYYYGDADLKLSAQSWPRSLTVARLGVATSKTGQQRPVSDALAPAWGATVVGGGAVPVTVMSNGTNWVVR